MPPIVFFIVGLLGLSVGLIVFLLVQLRPQRDEVAVRKRLAEMDEILENPFGDLARRRRQAQRERYEALIRELGAWVVERRQDGGETQSRLVMGGFRPPRAEPVFWGLRVVLTAALPAVAFFGASLLGYSLFTSGVAGAFGAGLGWITPSFYLDHRIRARQHEIRRTLPDALDLLVVCVEAGMGLDAAVAKVTDPDIMGVATPLHTEMRRMHLEFRAGRPRTEAMHALGERTGVDEVRKITAAFIQTEKLGTSLANTLRIHAETSRVQRRLRAEKAAHLVPPAAPALGGVR